MELRELRYFQTVALCGSYSRGSELLHISQPAVSRAIRQLEDELGTVLFERHSHGVKLTDAGQILLARSQMLLRAVEQTKAEVQTGVTSPSGHISFAITPAAGGVLVPALIEHFSARYPNVFINIIGGFSASIHEWLVRGYVDLACAHDPLPQRGFELTPLIGEEVFLIGKSGLSGLPKDYVRTDDLKDIPLILPSGENASRRLLEKWTAPLGVTLNIKLEVNDHFIMRSLVRSGAGYTLVSRGAIDDDLEKYGLQVWPFRPKAYWPLALVTCNKTPRTEIVNAFIESIRTVTHNLSRSGRWVGVPLLAD